MVDRTAHLDHISYNGISLNGKLRTIWAKFKKEGDPDSRNALLEHYFHMVKQQAEIIASRLPPNIDAEDLMGEGIFGLLGALKGFDLDRGTKFEVYAFPKIKGAMLDSVRKCDWVTRPARDTEKKVSGAEQRFFLEHGRRPSEEEILGILKDSEQDWNKVSRDRSPVKMESLNRRLSKTDGSKGVERICLVEDLTSENPFTKVCSEDLLNFLTEDLSGTDKLIFTLYYYEGMFMSEIADQVDYTESGVLYRIKIILGKLKLSIKDQLM